MVYIHTAECKGLLPTPINFGGFIFWNASTIFVIGVKRCSWLISCFLSSQIRFYTWLWFHSEQFAYPLWLLEILLVLQMIISPPPDQTRCSQEDDVTEHHWCRSEGDCSRAEYQLASGFRGGYEE
ncbi:hypothetical protein NE237_023408 [Protea cynaroides]|uniref:Uncharacterized protein n=1 Tax=Protea cynaroides TaxID=273540 RepID=A0A9Q0K4F2_9MAGN|nr:hypothetical protein NE237_023408 [Protea cynaroides]